MLMKHVNSPCGILATLSSRTPAARLQAEFAQRVKAAEADSQKPPVLDEKRRVIEKNVLDL
jgi:hypothetical protein